MENNNIEITEAESAENVIKSIIELKLATMDLVKLVKECDDKLVKYLVKTGRLTEQKEFPQGGFISNAPSGEYVIKIK